MPTRLATRLHHANATEPEIPAALVRVVGGVVSLHDFHSEPMHGPVRSHRLNLPAEARTIWPPRTSPPSTISFRCTSKPSTAADSPSRSSRARTSSSQTCASSELFLDCPPMIRRSSSTELTQAFSVRVKRPKRDLDVEWSGAVARNATIKFVVSKSTNSSDGVDLSAQYIVNHNLAPVMSTSFGLCEASLGSSGNAFLNSLWQQAAAQGITVIVSSGDNGAAGCDSASAASATHGHGVNGLCSTPYSVCVGGSEFNDASSPSALLVVIECHGVRIISYKLYTGNDLERKRSGRRTVGEWRRR